MNHLPDNYLQGIITLIVGAAGAIFAWLRTRKRDTVDTSNTASSAAITASTSAIAIVEKQRDDALTRESGLRVELRDVRAELRAKDAEFEHLQDALAEANRLLIATQAQLREATASFEAFRIRYGQTP